MPLVRIIFGEPAIVRIIFGETNIVRIIFGEPVIAHHLRHSGLKLIVTLRHGAVCALRVYR